MERTDPAPRVSALEDPALELREHPHIIIPRQQLLGTTVWYSMQKESDGLRYDHRWFFTAPIAHCLPFHFTAVMHGPVRILEIGSFEGLSTVWFLRTFCIDPASSIVCVDPWILEDHHNTAVDVNETTEAHFDHNIAPFRSQVTKFKGTAETYFASVSEAETFDLVYVDGSHEYEDALFDMQHAWPHVTPGGLMLADDFFSPPVRRAATEFANAARDAGDLKGITSFANHQALFHKRP